MRSTPGRWYWNGYCGVGFEAAFYGTSQPGDSKLLFAFAKSLRQRATWRKGLAQRKSLVGLSFMGLAPMRQGLRPARTIVPLSADEGRFGRRVGA
jgi:hypothetical protein